MKKLWIFFAALFCVMSAHAQQLDNLSMDVWSKEGKVWTARSWGSGNKGTITLGKNVTEPEEEFVAVKGTGKKAVRLRSEFIGVLGMGKFASASLFTGRFLKVVGTKGARLSFGVPFSARPKSLHGYYSYRPGKIDYVSDKLKNLKGKMDEGRIEINLTAWKEPFVIDNSCGIELTPSVEGIIGYGVLTLTKATDGYVEFEIPIRYTGTETPSYIGIMASSSRWGGDFTGSTGSLLYLDEFELLY